ncbi:hypothetical protein [Pseudomonas oryzihabitans]|uniref:TIGR04255 family protein n=1 Tax=Pseudomonas oryzihabitans TaxID=47885 RepID=A0A1G5N141_9PSED|nr:hypothetical protein [Pseudomonas psychrotolerans]NMY90067.1 hypothetical protein [Pseudomonas psychrotolerans]SCZ30501.1 hypothetical protein SAMN05216279_103374 [Pseudomonas psychrotolerans]
MEKIIKLQLALFFGVPELRPDKKYERINEEMGNLFDAMPQIMPLPPEVPFDLPRVVMTSSDQRYSCNIAGSRIDLHYNADGLGENAWPTVVQDFKIKSRLFIRAVSGSFVVNRFGLVGAFFIPDKSAEVNLSRKYIKPELGVLEEINIRYNKRSQTHGLTLNNIFSINSAELSATGEKGVYLERDLNNVVESDRLGSDVISAVVDKSLDMYSPEYIKGLAR